MDGTIPQRIQGLSSFTAALLVALLFALVGSIDLITGAELSFSLFYLLPVVVVSFRWGTATGQAAAGAAAAIWLVIDLASGARYSHPLTPLWNAAMRFGFFSLFSWLLGSLHRAVARETSLARTDSLTGLPNRRAFSEIAVRELARSARMGSGIAVAAIDLDDFKLVNDRRGHEGGDEVLCRFGAVAGRVLRSIDVTARTGGDEFAVLLPDVDGAEAVKVLLRLRRALATHEEGGIACSIGVAHGSGGALSDILRSADDALYQAKAVGKGSIVMVELASESAGASPSADQDPGDEASRSLVVARN